MVKYAGSVVVPFARERVWKLMSDWTNLAAWDLNITHSALAAGQPPGAAGVGTKYDVLFSANGLKNVKVSYTCTAFDPPERCQYLGLATLFRSQDSVACEALPDGQTKITAEFNLSFRSVLAPLSFLMNGAMQETGPVVMKDIEKFVTEQLAEKEQN